MSDPKEPTGEQCTKQESVGRNMFACWYPQMGGYVSKCVVLVNEEGPQTCFEAWVWHDGEWPFRDDYDVELEDGQRGFNGVRHLHHCSAEQFIRFGQQVLKWQNETGGTGE